jgi:hypothetical protein
LGKPNLKEVVKGIVSWCECVCGVKVMVSEEERVVSFDHVANLFTKQPALHT